MTTENPVSPRVAWKAALLGLLISGLGQLYSGRPYRALILHVLSNVVGVICIFALFLNPKPWNIVMPISGVLLWSILVLADAARCARRAAPDYLRKVYNRWYVYLLLIILELAGQPALTSFMRARYLQAFRIPLQSMAPTLVVGDRLVVDKFHYALPSRGLARLIPRRDPQRGDLAVFNFTFTDQGMTQNDTYIKRVIGLPGDRIRIVHRQVFVNGSPLNESYAYHDPAYADETRPGDNLPPSDSDSHSGITASWDAEISNNVKDGELIVPPEKYFVLGDNREQSWDSRFWGFVRRNDILGKADVIYFSWDKKAHHIRWDRIGEILK